MQGTLITVGTSPESVHFINLANDDVSTQKVKATLGCLCSLDIEPLHAMEAAVITTAGMRALRAHLIILFLGHVYIFRSSESGKAWPCVANFKAHDGGAQNTSAIRYSACGTFLATSTYGAKTTDSTWKVWSFQNTEGFYFGHLFGT
jgi:hypothetical protein